MSRYRAAVIGCGRIGAGLGWPAQPFIYDHCSAYLALKNRVELAWVFDRYHHKASEAALKFRVPGIGASSCGYRCHPTWQETLDDVLKSHPVDIVSVCVRPEEREAVMAVLATSPTIKGAWIEKPLGAAPIPGHWKVNVNYIRRFDPDHVDLAAAMGTRGARELWVWAKKDVHTVCHFTDLARFWGVPREGLHYFAMDGPNSYVVRRQDGSTRFFPLGGIPDGSPCMMRALQNLLDSVDNDYETWSSPVTARESEAWADEILSAK